MRPKTLTWLTLGLLAATLLSVALVDRPLALLINEQLRGATRIASAVTTALEWIFAFEVSKYLYAFVFLLVALVFNVWDRGLRRARLWYFLGTTLILSRVISGTLKNVFERVRPRAFLESRASPDFFVDGGSSFPSGHAAFYFGLLFPLALLFPKMKWPLLGIAALGALARVFDLDHYLGDVLASAVVAVLVVFLLARLLRFPSAMNKEPA